MMIRAIYAFRGADVSNMRDFEREFHVKHMIRLEQNYRSHGNILDAANAIIQNNPQRLGKNLWTHAGSGEPIRVYEAYSDSDEAHWIVEEVKSLVRDGHTRAEIALLYRSNAQSRALEHALFNAGIPYRVYGGLRFFERAEVKHALAYLRLIANVNDDTAFARVVNFPVRGIGARSLEALQDAAKAANSSFFAAIPQVSGKGGASLAAFAQLIHQLSEAAHLPLPELIAHVLELSGLHTHYQNEKEGQERLANLDELINAAASFIAEEGTASEEGELSADLAAFLSHASLEAGEHQAGEGDDALQLMTVHSAKGLEFNMVFISGLEEGLFPHENAVNDIKNGSDGLEEERRLMYVAVTRARQRLYLSIAQSRMLHGQTRYNLPSRFLDEIPKELLKWLTPRMEKQHFAVSPARPAGSTLGVPTFHGKSHVTAQRTDHIGNPPKDSGFSIGMNVHHTKFGPGVIVNAEGSGTDARVQVNFKAAGVKWLALAIAKLEAA
jgi:DNA helicase-2/ATP-dependent DNA helicase PcrA